MLQPHNLAPFHHTVFKLVTKVAIGSQREFTLRRAAVHFITRGILIWRGSLVHSSGQNRRILAISVLLLVTHDDLSIANVHK